MLVKTRNTRNSSTKLAEGTYSVTVDKVWSGSTSYGIPYLHIKFESDYGMYSQKFYMSYNRLSNDMKALFEACGVNTKGQSVVWSSSLRGKELLLTLDNVPYVDPETGELEQMLLATGFERPMSSRFDLSSN